jgi:hypothetical protein
LTLEKGSTLPNNYFASLIQVRPQYTGGDRDAAENVLWFKGTFGAALTVAQATAIAAVFDPLWGAMWKEVGVSSATYTGSIITDWSSNTGIQYSSVGTYAGQVGLGTGITGASTAALVSEEVAVRFKGGHGRIYLPYVANSVLATVTTLAAGTVTSTQTNFTAMVTGMAAIAAGNGGGFVPQLFRYRNWKGGANPNPAALYPFLTHVVDTVLASQRKRQRRVSRH